MHQRPIISAALTASTGEDGRKLRNLLADLPLGETSLRLEALPGGHKFKLSGSSESDLQAICDSVNRECRAEIGAAQVIYLETIRRQSDAEGKYIRQTGGCGNYGHVKLNLAPLDSGAGLQFLNELGEGSIPSEFVEPIDRGVRRAAMTGILRGFEMTDLRVVLYAGSYHDQDSNAGAFSIAAGTAFVEAARKASPIVLEPIMSVEVTVPLEFAPDVLADLNARRGRVRNIEHRAGSQVVYADAPMAELLGYAARLQAVTQDSATLGMQFARYAPLPDDDLDDGGFRVAANNPRWPITGSGSATADSQSH